jgi:hypothetical protein
MSDNTGMRRYSQLAAMSQRRLEELAEAGALVPGSTFARKGRHALPEKPTKRHPLPTGPDSRIVGIVLRRALREDGQIHCECCAEVAWGERAWDYSIHHRRGRQGQRTDNTVPNLVVVCGTDNQSGCHGLIHQRRSWSQPLGLWLPRNGIRTDPALVPVTIDRGSRVVYLGADGRYHDNPPEGVLAGAS